MSLARNWLKNTFKRYCIEHIIPEGAVEFNNTCTQRFNNNVSRLNREKWLEETIKKARKMGIEELFYKETENGFEFVFDNAKDVFLFNSKAVSNTEEGSYEHHQTFDTPEIQEAWTNLAEEYLQNEGIKYKIERYNGKTILHFDRVSDFSGLGESIWNGELNKKANALLKNRPTMALQL